MNTGLAILIARTKTHPEEFIMRNNEYSDWSEQIEVFKNYMTDEEKAAWQEATHDLTNWHKNRQRDDFTEYVMKKLAGVADTESVSSAKYTAQLAMSMKNTKEVLQAGLMKTFAEQYKHQDFVNAIRIEE
jgi:DNA-binding helix-hairpin-helix protein with protein kinase domain